MDSTTPSGGAPAQSSSTNNVDSFALPNGKVVKKASKKKSYASETDSDNDGGKEISLKGTKKRRNKHKKIHRDHPEFELTYDMMLGIRTTVGTSESKPLRDLTVADFAEETRLPFRSEGSSLTPAHSMRDFKFKDYAPEVFRHLRLRFGIKPVEYIITVCGNFELLEFISNSKSGQFFFYTHDRQFMIKTVTQSECKFLRKILPHYYHHVMNNPHSLLTRIVGMHRVKPHKKPEVHFLIFGSVFFNSKFIHRTFDLKGSSQGRFATEAEKKVSTSVFKDNDFLQEGIKLRVGPKAQLLKEQIDKDVEFLRQLGIMDYSLLLGIHRMHDGVPPKGNRTDEEPDEETADNGTRQAANAQAVPPSTESSLTGPDAVAPSSAAVVVTQPEDRPPPDDSDEKVPDRPHVGVVEERRQSNYGLPSNYNKFSKPEDIQFVAPEFAPPPLPDHKELSNNQQRIKFVQSIFTMDEGGCRAMDASGKPLDEYYYMGIIDILTVYGVKKRAEHFGKSFKYASDSISAVSPKAYAKRFKKFMNAAIE